MYKNVYESCLLSVCSILHTGTVYDYYFHKQGPGQWNSWTESITKEDKVIPAGAKVSSQKSGLLELTKTIKLQLKPTFLLTEVKYKKT